MMTPQEVCELTYSKCKNPNDDNASSRDLGVPMKIVMNWLWNGDVSSITEYYRLLDEKKLCLLLLAGMVRAAFGHGAQISTWNDYRLRAIEEAKARFPDTYQDAFCGLLDISWAETKTGTEGSFDRLIGIHPTFVRD